MFIKFSWRQVFTTLIFLNDLLLSDIFFCSLNFFFFVRSFTSVSSAGFSLSLAPFVRFISFRIIFSSPSSSSTSSSFLSCRSHYYYIFRFFFFQIRFFYRFFALECLRRLCIGWTLCSCVCMCIIMNAMKNINGRRLILLLSSSHNYVNFFHASQSGKKTRARIIQLNGQYETRSAFSTRPPCDRKKPFSFRSMLPATSRQPSDIFIIFYFINFFAWSPPAFCVCLVRNAKKKKE